MKRIIYLLIVFTGLIYAQQDKPQYDSTLAKSLNADDRGMKKYVLAILKTGTANITDKSVRDSLFKGHFANINKLAAEKKLVVAGPLGDNDMKYRGIFIFNTESIEEAKKYVADDPTVTSQIFDVEYIVWYGSAAMQEVTRIHNTIQKNKLE